MNISFDLKCTLLCNNDCVHCVVQDLRNNMGASRHNCHPDTSTLINEISKEYYRGARSITFTGGEPTLRKDLIDLIEHTKKTGYDFVYLQTNARLFRRSGLAIKVAKTGLNNAAVPLLGKTSKVHDLITQRKGSFGETIDGIKALSDAGVSICGRSVFLKPNLTEMNDICALFIKLGASRILLSFPRIDRSMGAYRNYKELVPTYAKIRESLTGIKQLIGMIPIQFEGFPLCALPGFEQRSDDLLWLDAPSKSLLIKYPGTQTMESSLPWGEKIRIHTSDCKDCLYSSVCYGSYKVHVELYGNKEHTPDCGPDESNLILCEIKRRQTRTTHISMREFKW